MTVSEVDGGFCSVSVVYGAFLCWNRYGQVKSWSNHQCLAAHLAPLSNKLNVTWALGARNASDMKSFEGNCYLDGRTIAPSVRKAKDKVVNWAFEDQDTNMFICALQSLRTVVFSSSWCFSALWLCLWQRSKGDYISVRSFCQHGLVSVGRGDKNTRRSKL